MSRGDRWFAGWFAACAVLGLVWIGVLIWGVIELVGWVTSK